MNLKIPLLRRVPRPLWGSVAILLAIVSMGQMPSEGRPGAITLSADSVSSPGYIASKLAFKDQYDFIRYDTNYWQWDSVSAVSHFFEALKNSRGKKVTVMHIGDSHVQADIGTGHVRNFMQQVFGPGGRGLMFPYACARTHPPVDYQTYSSGRWTCARNVNSSPSLPLGTMGVSAETEDSAATFRMIFNKYYNDVNPTVIKVFCEQGEDTYDLKLKYGPEAGDTLIIQTWFSHRPYSIAFLPSSPGMLEFSLVKTNPNQKYFRLYGISLETPLNQGIIYHSVGINGANFQHALQQDKMEEELKVTEPDLVVMDLSGNEFYHGLNESSFRERLTELLRKLRQGAPQASILVTCSQDIYRNYYHNIGEASRAAALAREVAFAEGCAFYDYYEVSGGRYSMLKWRNLSLAKRDRVHLTYEGYLLKGELFANALLTSYHQYLVGEHTPPYISDSLPKPRFNNPLRTTPYTPIPASQLPAAAAQWTAPQPPAGVPARSYVVQQGDVLGSIAEKYGVGVWQIRQWNGLHGDFIRVGQQLTIYSHKTPTPAATVAAKPITTPQSAPASGKAVFHVVERGDTLYGLSKKYGTSVGDIKSLSGISSDNLKPGQRLRVK